MKTAYFHFATLFLLFSISGCPNPSGTDDGAGTPTINKSIILKDGNGVTLGYVTSSGSISVTIFTSKKYFVNLNWDGTLADSFCYYTGLNGTGTPFYAYLPTVKLYGFTSAINSQLYVPSTSDSHGLAIADVAITSFQSMYSFGTLTNYGSPQTVSSIYVAYPLRVATRTEVGIPNTIGLPLELVFQ